MIVEADNSTSGGWAGDWDLRLHSQLKTVWWSVPWASPVAFSVFCFLTGCRQPDNPCYWRQSALFKVHQFNCSENSLTETPRRNFVVVVVLPTWLNQTNPDMINQTDPGISETFGRWRPLSTAVLPLSNRAKKSTLPAEVPRDCGSACLRNIKENLEEASPLQAPVDVASPNMLVTVNSGCEGTLILPWPFVI